MNRFTNETISVNHTAWVEYDEVDFKDIDRRRNWALHNLNALEAAKFNSFGHFCEFDKSLDQIPGVDPTRLTTNHDEVWCRDGDGECLDSEGLVSDYFWNDFRMLRWLNDPVGPSGAGREVAWLPVLQFAAGDEGADHGFDGRRTPWDPEDNLTNINWFIARFPDPFYDDVYGVDPFATSCDNIAKVALANDPDTTRGHRYQGLAEREELIGICLGQENAWFTSKNALGGGTNNPWNRREWLRWLIMGWRQPAGAEPCESEADCEPTPGKLAFVAAMKERYGLIAEDCTHAGDCDASDKAICHWNNTYQAGGNNFCITSWDAPGDPNSLLRTSTVYDVCQLYGREPFVLPFVDHSADQFEPILEAAAQIIDPLYPNQLNAPPVDLGWWLKQDDADHFMKMVAEEFYSKAYAAIKTYDTDHLIFSDRYVWSIEGRAFIEIASNYVDALCVNMYVPPELVDSERSKLESLYDSPDKQVPVLITEFSYHNDHWGHNPHRQDVGWDGCWYERDHDKRCADCPGNPGGVPVEDCAGIFAYPEVGTGVAAVSAQNRANAYSSFVRKMLEAKGCNGCNPLATGAGQAEFVLGAIWYSLFDHQITRLSGELATTDQTQNFGLLKPTDDTPQPVSVLETVVDQYQPLRESMECTNKHLRAYFDPTHVDCEAGEN